MFIALRSVRSDIFIELAIVNLIFSARSDIAMSLRAELF